MLLVSWTVSTCAMYGSVELLSLPLCCGSTSNYRRRSTTQPANVESMLLVSWTVSTCAMYGSVELPSLPLCCSSISNYRRPHDLPQ
ncbi:hypothetical protein FB451DRAFT_1293703 [Mycena latifolia]|nr:hypothetical protein FB451DRAFT_1293703 [Mycena latifolia]